MSDWKIKGEERYTAGHGESGRRVVIQHTIYPNLRIMIDDLWNNELQDQVAVSLCSQLNIMGFMK